MHPRSRRAVVASLAILLSGCAAREALNRYPRAEIDRPYTLPEGVVTWTGAVAVTRARDDFESHVFAGVSPLAWAVPLSDTWTLHATPFAPAISHQLLRTDDQWLGARLGIGFGLGSEGVLLAPELTMSHRIRLSSNVAWGTGIGGSFSRWTEQPTSGWGVTAATGPLWQIAETFAVEPAVGLSYARRHLALGAWPLESSAHLSVPLALAATFSVSRQWDLHASFEYDGIGYDNGYREYTGTFRVVHLW
jgi:hypothetical protein